MNERFTDDIPMEAFVPGKRLVSDIQKNRSDEATPKEAAMTDEEKCSKQIVGNMGLYVVCWELSKRGWNVMPTARNAKGVDIVGYNADASKQITVQVKAQSEPMDVGMSAGGMDLIADYLIVATKVASEKPEFFVMGKDEARRQIYVGAKENDCWLERRIYQNYRERWDLIGYGGTTT